MKIEELVDEYKNKFLHPSWQWRAGQKELIIQIAELYLSGEHKSVICECPTGSGKSHIAMCLSYVLNKHKKEGYILTSDIALQNQYENDLVDCNINWGSVKGVDRYLCSENNEIHSLGVCKMKKCNPKELSCYSDCPYYYNRNKAAASNTAVLNYSYWLIQMNEVLKKADDPLFTPRDFIICDEAHKITDIVQNHYSPKLSLDLLTKIDSLIEFLRNNKLDNLIPSLEKSQTIIKFLFKDVSSQQIYVLMHGLKDSLAMIAEYSEVFAKRANELFGDEKLPSDWNSANRNMLFLVTLSSTIETYLSMVEKTGLESIVKNPISETDIVFNFLYTNFMVEEFFHKFAKFGVFLSATIGNPQDFCSDMQIADGIFLKMHSSFDFSRSPIHFHNSHRMSYNKMEDNTPWLISKIDEYMKKHRGQKGMIHSGSYDLSLKIFNSLSPENKDRILVYNGAEEKEECIRQLKASSDKVIIGPSLIEGVNLPGEHCRFLIFAKVPYLSLGDKFVKAKINLEPKWYQMKAVINMLQGVGRGVRDGEDWCETYILDANFGDLMTKNILAFPDEFKSRIVLHRS